MRINRTIFYQEFRKWRTHVTQNQVRGLNFLLDCIEQDSHITRLEWAAYMLGTIKLETADTYLPIHEYGGRNYFIGRYGGQTRKGRELGNDTPEEGADYAGAGFVQLTGETNYENMEIAVRREYPNLVAQFERETGRKFDLTVGDQPNDKSDPQNAMHPRIAYAIMSYGMRHGSFTGHSLAKYTSPNGFDWVNARRIINGLDKASTIADYARMFYSILRKSVEVTPQNVGLAIDSKIRETADHETPLASQLNPADAEISLISETKDNSATPSVSDNQPSQPQTDSKPPVNDQQVICKERPSTFTRWITGIKTFLGAVITFIGGYLGIDDIKTAVAANQDKILNAEVLALIGLLIIKLAAIVGVGLGLMWLAAWFYDRSANRANALNQQKMAIAADKNLITTELNANKDLASEYKEFLKWKEAK